MSPRVDLSQALEDESNAVAAANDKIIEELPVCVRQLETAINKMRRALKQWYAFTSYQFDGPSEMCSFVDVEGDGVRYKSDLSGVKWSFDMRGRTTNARRYDVENSARAEGFPAGGGRLFKSMFDCWADFNIYLSFAAEVIEEAFENMTAGITLEELDRLGTLPDDLQNAAIEGIFENNHRNMNYCFGAGPETRSEFEHDEATNTFIRGFYGQTIAGQVWPSFTLGDTSPENMYGVNADRYYLDVSIASLSQKPISDNDSVEDGMGWVSDSGASILKIHPSAVFNNADYSQWGDTARVSTEFLNQLSSVIEYTVVTTAGKPRAYNDSASYKARGGSWSMLNWANIEDTSFLIDQVFGYGEAQEGTIAAQQAYDNMSIGLDAVKGTYQIGGLHYARAHLALWNCHKSYIFKAFFGRWASNERPELINWWINPNPSGRKSNADCMFSYKGFYGTLTGHATWKLEGTPSYLKPRAMNTNYSRGTTSATPTPDSNTYGYARAQEFGTSKSFCDLEFPGTELSFVGAGETYPPSGWESGYIVGTECPDANKNVVIAPGTDYQYTVTRSPLTGLIDLYKNLKEVFLEDLREASGCIVQLALERQEARIKLNVTARSVLANPASTAAEREAAASAIGRLARTRTDFVAGCSAFNESLIFREQCYLMANILDLASYSEQSSGGPGSTSRSNYKRLPYSSGIQRNASMMVDADNPFAFMNALSLGATDAEFFEMKNHDISTLQPMIQLYKISFDEVDRVERSQRVMFESFADTVNNDSLLQDKQRRGFGVGIKSFSFKYAGSNPFAVKRSISATLKIFANSFDELLTERTSNVFKNGAFVPQNYRYVDLALKTANTQRTRCERSFINRENEEFAKLNFRLKAVVGWALPGGKTDHLSTGVKNALYNSFVTLNLTPTVHDFEFDDQGRVTFTINYLAYTDDFFDQEDYNIFLDPDIANAQRARRQQFDQLREQCQTETIEQLREDMIPEIQREKMTSVATLINDLMYRDKIFYISLPLQGIRNFVATGPFYNNGEDTVVPVTNEELNTSLGAMIASSLEQYTENNPDEAVSQVRAALVSVNPNASTVAFFYLRDLVDIVLVKVENGLRRMVGELEEDIPDWAMPITEADAEAAYEDAIASLEYSVGFAESELMGSVIDFVHADDPQLTIDFLAEHGIYMDPLVERLADTVVTEDESPDDADFVGPLPDMDAEAMSYPTAEENLFARAGFDETDIESRLETYHALRAELATAQAELREAGEDPDVMATRIAAMQRERDIEAGSITRGSAEDCLKVAEYTKMLRLKEQFQKFRLVLGPVEIFNPRNDLLSTTVNFGDMPISVKYFIEFLTEKLATKEETIYPMANFFNDLMNALVRNFLNDDTCFTGINSSQKVTMTNASVAAFSRDDVDPLSLAFTRRFEDDDLTVMEQTNRRRGRAVGPGRANLRNLDQRPILNVSGQRDTPDSEIRNLRDEEYNYMVFFAGRAKPARGMRGQKSADVSRGVFHYELGREKGIVKTIQLTKTSTPGLQEVRFEQDGYDGLRQLRVVYDVNIETYANVHAYPGTYIFVNPRSFAPSSNLTPCHEFNLTEYGIGGYYMIITSEHTFAAGRANTKIFAKWVSEIDRTDARLCDNEGASGGTRTRRCDS